MDGGLKKGGPGECGGPDEVGERPLCLPPAQSAGTQRTIVTFVAGPWGGLSVLGLPGGSDQRFPQILWVGVGKCGLWLTSQQPEILRKT